MGNSLTNEDSIVAQRDYVRRAQSTGTRRKKNTSRKKQQRSSVSPTMVAIAAAVVVAFVGALYFITHRKAEEIDVIPSHKVTGNGLPPKPEERWKYIKELENRQPGVLTPTEPSAGGEVLNQRQLTNEQRQLLEQMQADMRQQPTQLNEVPWNGQTPSTPPRSNRSQTLQPELGTAQRVGQNQNTRTTASAPQTAPSTVPPSPPKPAVTKREIIPATPAAPVTTVTREPEAAKAAPQEKKDTRRWMVQCGSFKRAEQAETVRAQLAFEGFGSHITTNNGWNRVVIGPLTGKESADNTLSQLKLSGHSNCIRLPYGG